MHDSHACPEDKPHPLDARAAAPSTTAHRRAWLIALVVLAPLLVLAGCWWCWHLPNYHLVGRYPIQDYSLLACTDGFYTRESPGQFVFRDWNGQERWRLATAATPPPGQHATPRVFPGVRLRTPSSLSYAASPDGHVFAAVMGAGMRTRVQVWRDGRPTGDLLLPEPFLMVPQRWVHALDNGRVYVWENAFDWPLVAIDNGRIVASGHFPALGVISPDGSVVATQTGAGFTYATLTVHEGSIHITPRYTGIGALSIMRLPELTLNSSLFTGGYLLTQDGAVYNAAGRVSAANAWRHEALAPGQRYTLQFDETHSRVYSPVTGDAWTYAVSGVNKGGDATSDGRFALAYCTAHIPPHLMNLLLGMPMLSDMFKRLSLDYLALYERPGRLRAVLRLDLLNRVPHLTRIDDYWWFPSPDGHTIAMTVTGNTSECLVFRW